MKYPKDKFILRLCAFCIQDYHADSFQLPIDITDIKFYQTDFDHCDFLSRKRFKNILKRNTSFLEARKIELNFDNVIQKEL